MFPDPYFEQGMAFWQLTTSSQGSVINSTTAIAGTHVFTNTMNQQAWISSSRLVPVNAQHTYQVRGSFRRPTTTGSAGGFYLAVRLLDANQAEINGDGSWWFYPVSNASLTDTNWHTYSATFGDGTARPLPANARYMSVGAILNYDGAVAGNRNYEVAGLGIQDIPHASQANFDGQAAVGAGTANALYTPPITFPQGVYLVQPYNCLTGASTNYYVQWTAVADSGSIVAGFFNRDFNQMVVFSQGSFALRVTSPSAQVRFKVFNPSTAAATITNPPNNCTNFTWMQIGL